MYLAAATLFSLKSRKQDIAGRIDMSHDMSGRVLYRIDMSGGVPRSGARQAGGCVCSDCLLGVGPVICPRAGATPGGLPGRAPQVGRTEATRVVSGHRRRRVLSQEGGRRAQRGET